MYIRIWELTGEDAPSLEAFGNELAISEWSQFGNGPRHTGLYAQPYSGLLPVGHSYWRDRVIIADDVSTGLGRILHIETNSPTVIEFNNEVTLHLNNMMDVSGVYRPVFKPN